MELFAKVVNGFTIFKKRSILDVRLGFEYAFGNHTLILNGGGHVSQNNVKAPNFRKLAIICGAVAGIIISLNFVFQLLDHLVLLT